MPTYRLLLEYDGAAYHGWQVQPELPTVQGALERALSLLTRRIVHTAGAGRTDRGVHAAGQVVSFRVDEPIDCRRVAQGIHGICGRDIRVVRIGEAPEGFHARHDAIWRQYRYRILDRPSALWRSRAYFPRRTASLPALRRASRALLGEHDMSSFANASPDAADPRCRILRAEWECWDAGFVFTIRADHFLYKMVRTLVGTLLREAAVGGDASERISRLVDARSRRLAAPPLPPEGLCLDAVGYDPPWPDTAFGCGG